MEKLCTQTPVITSVSFFEVYTPKTSPYLYFDEALI